MANVDTTMALDQASTDSVRLVIEQASDGVILRVFEMTGGLGPLADLAANEMETRNLDY